MFVFNNCKNDARVLKEAGSLTEAGFDVRIVAVLDMLTTPLEERNGFRIIRVRVVRSSFRYLQRILRHEVKKIQNHVRRLFNPLKRRNRIFRNRVRRLFYPLRRRIKIFRNRVLGLFNPLRRGVKYLLKTPRRILWRLAEVPFFHRIYLVLVKPVVVLARKIALLLSSLFRGTGEAKPGRAGFLAAVKYSDAGHIGQCGLYAPADNIKSNGLSRATDLVDLHYVCDKSDS